MIKPDKSESVKSHLADEESSQQSKEALGFAAIIAHLEETARLEREAGIVIGERRGLQRGEDIRRSQTSVIEQLEVEVAALRTSLTEAEQRRGRELAEAEQRRIAQAELTALINSTSWRVTAILRLAGRIIRGRSKTLIRPQFFTLSELRQEIEAIYASTSWRMTAPLRNMKSR